MISINESNTGIEVIKDRHLKFVGPHVKATIDFYIKVFTILPTIVDCGASDKFASKQIEALSKGNSSYKKLINAFLTPKGKLANKKDIPKMKFWNSYLIRAKKFKENQNLLTELLLIYENLLKIDFTKNQANTIRDYNNWKTKFKNIDFLLPHIFDYEQWFLNLPVEPKSSWGPYQLSMALDLKCCPYCNRQYTFSLVDDLGKKRGRPELDHFLPKSANPLLALSFYNLIPSCQGCNGSSIKGGNQTAYDTHINPYEDNAKSSHVRFTYVPRTYKAAIGMSEELDIEVKYAGDAKDKALQTKVEGNIKLFALEEIYKHHTDIVQDIVRKRHMSNDRHIQILQQTYKKFNLSLKDAYRLAFGNYYMESDFHRRPLAKLTKDIAIELTTLPLQKKQTNKTNAFFSKAAANF